MSKLTDKLHAVFTALRGGAEIAHHDVDAVVTELTTHLNETVIPPIESKVKELLADIDASIKTAVAEAVQFERAEAEKITSDLQAAYEKLANEFGAEKANQIASDAAHAAQEASAAAASA